MVVLIILNYFQLYFLNSTVQIIPFLIYINVLGYLFILLIFYRQLKNHYMTLHFLDINCDENLLVNK